MAPALTTNSATDDLLRSLGQAIEQVSSALSRIDAARLPAASAGVLRRDAAAILRDLESIRALREVFHVQRAFKEIGEGVGVRPPRAQRELLLPLAEGFVSKNRSREEWRAFLDKNHNALVEELARDVLPDLTFTIFQGEGYERRLGPWHRWKDEALPAVLEFVGLGLPDFDPRRGKSLRDYVRSGVSTCLRNFPGLNNPRPRRIRDQMRAVSRARYHLQREYSPEVVESGRLDPLIAERAGLAGSLQEFRADVARSLPRPLFFPGADDPDESVLRNDIAQASPSPDSLAQSAEVQTCLQSALSRSRFSARNIRIFWLRFVEGWTLEEIGGHIGVTRERVRQVSEKVRTFLSQHQDLVLAGKQIASAANEVSSTRVVGLLDDASEELISELQERERGAERKKARSGATCRSELFAQLAALLGAEWVQNRVTLREVSAAASEIPAATLRPGENVARHLARHIACMPASTKTLLWERFPHHEFLRCAEAGGPIWSMLEECGASPGRVTTLVLTVALATLKPAELRSFLDETTRVALRLRRPLRIVTDVRELERSSFAAIVIGGKISVNDAEEAGESDG